MMRNAHAVLSFADLFAMTNASNPDLDLFQNLTHIQRHRRVRGIARLKELAASKAVTTLTARTIFLPLLAHYIVEPMRVSFGGVCFLLCEC
jgi:hypothetical protein